jgi:uncharacterized protein
MPDDVREWLSLDALDERIAIVGTSGSGKTYAAKGFVERLLDHGTRMAIVDPLGVWWGLRASADAAAAGYPVVVFGGRHADVPIDEGMGAALGRLIAREPLACVVDVSELGSAAARRRFMTAFAEAVYEGNREPLHLVFDEADLWAPQRPTPEGTALLGRIEEIVRRGRVRGFIPWLITQRPAVLHKDVLSQADTLIAMKLTSSQDRAAVGAWIEGQADREEGKRILADLPRLQRGEGYIWSPGREVLQRVRFPAIHTFDSSRAPARGERIATPRTLAQVDLTAIMAALESGAAEPAPARAHRDDRLIAVLERQLAEARDCAAVLEQENADLRRRLSDIASLAVGQTEEQRASDINAAIPNQGMPAPVAAIDVPSRWQDRKSSHREPKVVAGSGGKGAELRILRVLAQQHPARLAESQWAILSRMKRTGGTWQTYKSRLRSRGLIAQDGREWSVTPEGLAVAGVVPRQPQTPAELRSMWKEALGSAGRLIDVLLDAGGQLPRNELAARAGLTSNAGTFGTYLSRLRSNDLVSVAGSVVRIADALCG